MGWFRPARAGIFDRLPILRDRSIKNFQLRGWIPGLVRQAQDLPWRGMPWMLSTAPVGKLLGISASRPPASVQGLGFTYLGKILVGSSLTPYQ